MFDKRCNGFENNQYDMNDYDKMPAIDNNMVGSNCTMQGVVCPPIYECPRENEIHRTIMHQVPHIIPCNTKVINHHVYRHTYTPCYSMSECDTCENIYDNGCC